jgi:hypothetical protein
MNLNEMGMHPGAQMSREEEIGSVYGQEPPISNLELAIEDCIQQKESQGISRCEAEPLCRQEVGMPMDDEMPSLEKDPEIPFQEGKDSSPDEGDTEKDSKPSEDEKVHRHNTPDKPDVGITSRIDKKHQEKEKTMKESVNRTLRVTIKR